METILKSGDIHGNSSKDMITFITGNKKKFAEAQAVFPGIKQRDIDLPEIQEIDPHAIIRAKLQAAFAHAEGEFIVEDTSLYFEGLGGLPGPLIKWFLQELAPSGLALLVQKLGNDRAVAKTVIGYAQSRDHVQFFEGAITGRIVAPRNDTFGWDPIFLPDGHSKVFGEMAPEEKNEISMRRLALNKLKEFLEMNEKPAH